jgi:hypothetical protein
VGVREAAERKGGNNRGTGKHGCLLEVRRD